MDFNPLRAIPWAFKFLEQDIGQVSRLRHGKFIFILKSYPFFKSLTVLCKTVETGLDLHLEEYLKYRGRVDDKQTSESKMRAWRMQRKAGQDQAE